MADLTCTADLPHDGPGTHTLVVAIPISDDILADPTRHHEIVDALVLETVRTLGGWHATNCRHDAIVRCETCDQAAMGGGRWCVDCFTTRTAPPSRRAPTRDRRCGTRAGYMRHWRANERACTGCRDAHAAYEDERRAVTA